MYIRKTIFAIAIFCIFATSWAGETIDLQIASFKLSGAALTESKIVTLLGNGYIKLEKIGDALVDKKHIYYMDNKKVWLSLRLSHVLNNKSEAIVDEIFVTKSKLCDEKYRPKENIDPLIKPTSIYFGKSVDGIISILGKPSVSLDIGKNKSYAGIIVEKMKYNAGRILRYLPDQSKDNDSLVQEFYFDKDGLHSLLISVAE